MTRGLVAKENKGAGEMVWLLDTLVALVEDPGSVPNTNMVADNYP